MAGSEFVDFLCEQLAPCGAVQARRMFGGHGLYQDGLMFALVADDVLYIKVDADTAAEFERLGLEAFSYQNARGTRCVMSYRAAPVEALDEPEALCHWMRLGLEAARRTAVRSKRRR